MTSFLVHTFIDGRNLIVGLQALSADFDGHRRPKVAPIDASRPCGYISTAFALIGRVCAFAHDGLCGAAKEHLLGYRRPPKARQRRNSARYVQKCGFQHQTATWWVTGSRQRDVGSPKSTFAHDRRPLRAAKAHPMHLKQRVLRQRVVSPSFSA